MKTLLIIRHAHAEAPKFGMSDFDRSLSSRGTEEATTQAKNILNKNIVLDGLLCSSSRRTMQTTEILRLQFKIEPENMRSVDILYQAAPMHLIAQTIQLPDEWSTVAIVAHNPGVSEFANTLTENFHIDDMPPASIVAVSSETEQWANFFKHQIRFLFFLIPK
jgi:phosphohistidine phosphatase